LAAVPPLPKSFEDAARRHLAVAEELERVCGSSHFRTSKRSCEFLQYIVQVTLDGRMDSLKERSIGIDLFGRDTSYEPSSDATVRVRANEVRKRLSSYYASAEIRSLRIDLPTGSYVPRFLPVTASGKPAAPVFLSVPQLTVQTVHGLEERQGLQVSERPAISAVTIPPMQALTLVRPALLALLLCTLLLRHQLENREEYLRFWDHLLSGRSAMVLSLSPQDRVSLAPSLYPLVWVAGRYGVDATMQGDSLTGTRPEATSSVHVSYTTPPELAADSRLRWALADAANPTSANPQTPLSVRSQSVLSQSVLLDRKPAGDGKSPLPTLVTSAALVTILPEDTATLQVQGTDADAIRRLLEELTVERNFPVGLVERVERLNSRHALQVLLFRNSAGEWRRDIFLGDA
jgi:hypothetical protein